MTSRVPSPRAFAYRAAASLSVPNRFAGALVAALALAAVTAGPAAASPIDDPHLGGIGFSGPATGDLAAVYWNPAALGLVPDSQVFLAATARFSSLSVARAPIDPATGQPGGGRTFPTVDGRGRLHPFGWPPGPGGFFALSASIGTRFTLAFGAFSPFAQRVLWSAAPDGQQPTRFHAVEIDLRDVALAPAFAIRLCCGIHIGGAPHFLFSVGRLTFDEDTALGGGGPASDCGGAPCGVENPAAAARYDVSSGLNPTDSSFAFLAAGGIHVQRPRWDAGLAYISRPLRTEHGIGIKGRNTTVTAAGRDRSGVPLCPSTEAGPCFYAQAEYGLPDVITGGFTYHFNPRLDLGFVLRWLNLSQHEDIEIRVVGPATGGLRAHGLP